MIEVPIEEAVDLIPDRCSLGIGGVLLKRKPMAILAELARAERTSIEAMTFLGSIDIELLASAGTIDTFSGGYVGFEHLGFAPAFTSAVAEGRIGYREHSEYLFMSGLRAAVAGVPFMPTKGAMGSELVTELGLVEIDDPYTGSPVIAVPAISPEVTVIHAEASDHDGNIGASTTADFLSDFDSTIARASTRVSVEVEEIVSTLAGPAMLLAAEVDAVMVAPKGASPTAVPGLYDADLAAIRAYLAEPSTGQLMRMINER